MKNVSPADWMSSVDGAKLLSELSIPGTHDTCTYNYGWYEPLSLNVRCQNDSLIEQLMKGIRCLDIRCRRIDECLTIHHGRFHLGMNFGEVIEQCKSFLQEHPGETIVMFVKREHDEEAKGSKLAYDDVFLKYINDKSAKDLFHVDNKVPALSSVRGKIVLLRRFPSQKKLGIDLDGGWEDDKSFSIDRSFAKFHIQDEYKVNMFRFGGKWEKVEKLLDDARGATATDWYINFTSGVAVTQPPIKVAIGNLFSKGINPRLSDYLSSPKNAGHVGTVIMDFPGDDIVANIIRRNIRPDVLNPDVLNEEI